MDAVEYVKTVYIEEFDSVKDAIKWLRREE